MQTIDLSDLPPSRAVQTLTRMASDIQSSFDLARPPLIKMTLFRLSDGDRLFIVMHHLLGDAVSWRIILEDLQSVYEQCLAGKTICLPQKSHPFPVWAKALEKYAREDELQREKTYWMEIINYPAGRLPSDIKEEKREGTIMERVPVENTQMEGSLIGDMDQITMDWDMDQTRALINSARSTGRGLDRLLLAALARACRCEHGKSATLISLESHGRVELFDHIDISRTVGWFTSQFPMIIEAPDDEEDHEVAIQTINRTLKRIPNMGIGWGILKYLATEKTLQHPTPGENDTNPDINFNYLGEFEAYGEGFFQPSKESTGPSVSDKASVIHHLDINGVIADKRLYMIWHFNKKRFSRVRIETMIKNFSRQLEK
ncbi:MAG: hypothetical protein HQK66_15650, partial [Desulfamplus sp.]|nr:hypothetical protein [Desulfamplus sp.]